MTRKRVLVSREVKRVHTREFMTLKEELSPMRIIDVSDTKKKVKGIQEWLGHETHKEFKSIKEVKVAVNLRASNT